LSRFTDPGWISQAPSGMIRTYIDEEHTPEESCGTALLAYVGL